MSKNEYHFEINIEAMHIKYEKIERRKEGLMKALLFIPFHFFFLHQISYVQQCLEFSSLDGYALE